MAVDAALLPRDDEDLEHFARACVAHYHAEFDSTEYQATDWTFDRFLYFENYLPKKAWRAALLIWSLDQSDATAQELGGHIGSLLHHFGPTIAPLAEAELQCDPTFARALGDDWKSIVDDKVWLKDVDPSLRPSDDEDMEHFARCWIAARKTESGSDEYNTLFWTNDRQTYLTQYLPQTAWRAIVLIWSLDQSLKTMQMLSAGFVEDLLDNHGPETIEAVEAEARSDPSFAKMLGGVWKSQMTDEIWDRLQKVLDPRGWDDIAE